MANLETGILADRVPYVRCGDGQREAAVFLPGNALFKSIDKTSAAARYAIQVARLLPGYRFTFLGYSGSNFPEIVEDMAAAVGKPPDAVVGISFGGFVAIRFAAQFPALVQRLVLLISAHRFSNDGLEMIQQQIAALEEEDFASIVRQNALLFRRPWYNWLVRCKLWKDTRRLISEMRNPAEILRNYRQLFGPDLHNNRDFAARVSCPTLIVGGTADQYFDREAFEETARMIPTAKLQLFERETHMLPVEKSRAVAAAIDDFLKRSR